jgi:hypothetical protein
MQDLFNPGTHSGVHKTKVGKDVNELDQSKSNSKRNLSYRNSFDRRKMKKPKRSFRTQNTAIPSIQTDLELDSLSIKEYKVKKFDWRKSATSNRSNKIEEMNQTIEKQLLVADILKKCKRDLM